MAFQIKSFNRGGRFLLRDKSEVGHYIADWTSTSITSIGLVPAFTSACIAADGFAGSR